MPRDNKDRKEKVRSKEAEQPRAKSASDAAVEKAEREAERTLTEEEHQETPSYEVGSRMFDLAGIANIQIGELESLTRSAQSNRIQHRIARVRERYNRSIQLMKKEINEYESENKKFPEALINVQRAVLESTQAKMEAAKIFLRFVRRGEGGKWELKEEFPVQDIDTILQPAIRHIAKLNAIDKVHGREKIDSLKELLKIMNVDPSHVDRLLSAYSSVGESEVSEEELRTELPELTEEEVMEEINDREIRSINALPEKYQRNLSVLARLVDKGMDRSTLEELPKDVEDDAAFMSALSERIASIVPGGSWSIMKFASDRLRGDRDFVSKEIERWPDGFVYASEELRSDRQLALRAIEVAASRRSNKDIPFYIIHGLPDALKRDERFIITAIEHSHSPGAILNAVFDTFGENISVVLAVVKKNPDTLHHLSKQMQKLVAEALQRQSKEQ